MATVELKEVELPDFGSPTVEPVIHARVYKARIDAAIARARAMNYNALVIYADREHCANMAYLTGFDPRFEEALLILVQNRMPTIVIGNECWTYSDISPVTSRKVLFQHFSLMGQPRDKSDMLDKVFRAEGITKNSKVGIVGWKYYVDRRWTTPRQIIDAPAYIVDTLRAITGNAALVENVADIFMNPDNGLRAISEVDQLAIFEYAATICSNSVKNILFGVKPGMTEYEGARLMNLNGMPLSCHPVFVTGPRTAQGLSSPSSKIINRGEQIAFACGIWGSLTCRAGFLVESEKELYPAIQDYVAKLVGPYFKAIAEWYSTIGIGVKGGVLYDIIFRNIGSPFFGVTLNPGHLIHIDEWVHSPIFKGSQIEMKSGMAMQVDVIPATNSAYYTTNIEDTIVLADEKLREEFAKKYPEAWGRIQARRKFMEEVIGIKLKPEVLPYSNMPAYLAPFILSPKKVMTLKS